MASISRSSPFPFFQLSTSLSIPPTHLSFCAKTLPSPNHLSGFSRLSLRPPRRLSTVIRMGGGPRTYPGGVSKWQWKRMQAKKAKQLLQARLARERQIYEMRKRAELKAAVADLERPWEVVDRAPTLFSVKADEQLKVLADRFQRPGGFDLWTERDGPQLFHTPEGLPSARFFPKGVVHSVKPYGKVEGYGELGSGSEEGSGDGEVSESGDGFGEESVSNRLLGELSRNRPMTGRIGPEYGRKGRGRRNLHTGQNGIGREEKDTAALIPCRDGGDSMMHGDRGNNRILRNGGDSMMHGDRGNSRIFRNGRDNRALRDGGNNRMLRNGGDNRMLKDGGNNRMLRNGGDNNGDGSRMNRTPGRVVNGDSRSNRSTGRIGWGGDKRTHGSDGGIGRGGSRMNRTPGRIVNGDRSNGSSRRIGGGGDNRTHGRDGGIGRDGSRMNRTPGRIVNGGRSTRSTGRIGGSGDDRTHGGDGRIGRGDNNRTNRRDGRVGRRDWWHSKGDSGTDVYDMSLQGDGSYGFRATN
ncbi:hypothetical protein Tsubulata_007992 [Turnera subulata]|uniref:DEAD-box ATP-dependent RNA helicase 33 n=1 Tax=Turnera subulata TaxID=218843 RepID=A0A9Q0FML7_9ROSI|nr:hypothetical protein Tsubulata_007992 [Turnera subulata]